MLLYSLAWVLHMLYYNFNKMADTSRSTFLFAFWTVMTNTGIYYGTSFIVTLAWVQTPPPSPSHKIRAWTKSLSMLHSNGDFYHRMKCKCIFKRKKIWSLWVNSIAKDEINFRGVDFKKQLLWTVKLEC